MSGAHLPYRIHCDDCNGNGTVTKAQAEAILRRYAEWDRRYAEYLNRPL